MSDKKDIRMHPVTNSGCGVQGKIIGHVVINNATRSITFEGEKVIVPSARYSAFGNLAIEQAHKLAIKNGGFLQIPQQAV